MTVCFLLRALMAPIRSRRAAACSKRRASASASISLVMSRSSCFDLPSSSAAACSIRRPYSSAVMAGRQKPSQHAI